MSCKVKKHLICLFRRTADPSWTAPSQSITALNNACQVEEVQQDSADERVKSAERMLESDSFPLDYVGKYLKSDCKMPGR